MWMTGFSRWATSSNGSTGRRFTTRFVKSTKRTAMPNQYTDPIPLWDRVWDKVRFPSWDLDECWIWTGAYSKKRRGVRPVVRDRPHRDAGHMVLVARVVCAWYRGPAPSTAD